VSHPRSTYGRMCTIRATFLLLILGKPQLNDGTPAVLGIHDSCA